MKRFLTTAVAMVAMTSAAHAGSLNLDMRLDYNSATYKDAGVPDTSKFYFKTGRLDYSGKATDDISFRARIAFTKTTTPGIDATQPAAELAYLTHKMSDNFSLTVGKFATELGGFEGTTSSADLYATSAFFTPSGNATTLFGTKDLLYMTGAKLTSTYEGNSLQLMVLNETDTKAGPTTTQNSNMFGVVYKGSFMEKALNFIASHHM
ncbi:MAG TPA: porin, partial [Bdellovibrio sp.]